MKKLRRSPHRFKYDYLIMNTQGSVWCITYFGIPVSRKAPVKLALKL